MKRHLLLRAVTSVSSGVSPILLGIAVLAMPVPASCSGLDLTWNDCVGGSFQLGTNFTNCSTSTARLTLYCSFKTDVPVPDFVAANLVFDVEQHVVPALEKFWRFDSAVSGGCNSSGIGIRNDVEPSLGPCHDQLSPWGFGGAEGSAIITQYVPGTFGSATRARLFATVFRDPQHPYPLDPGVNYYMCHFIINSSERASCPGCMGEVCVAWNTAELIDSSGSRTVLNQPDKIGNIVAINAPLFTCVGDPVQRRSWGQLKSLYR